MEDTVTRVPGVLLATRGLRKSEERLKWEMALTRKVLRTRQ